MNQIRQGNAGYLVTEVCLHTTATTKSWMHGYTVEEKAAEIRRWHVEERGWRDIGYHYVIDRDGSVAKGRSSWEIGAGVAGHNNGVIHIALVGGHGGASTDSFFDHYTSAQELALRALLREISKQTPLTLISGHNDYAAKACPCFKVISDDWMPKEDTHVEPGNKPRRRGGGDRGGLLPRLQTWFQRRIG